MSPEVQGAIVGGAIGGAVVLVGVLLTEGLVRSRERWREIEKAAIELSVLVPRVVTPFAESEPSPVGSAAWGEMHDRVNYLTAVIRSDAGGPSRRARDVRRQVDRLVARLAAAEQVHAVGRPLTPIDLMAIFDVVGDVTAQLLRRTKYLDREVRHHRKHGFETDPGDCSACAGDASASKPARG